MVGSILREEQEQDEEERKCQDRLIISEKSRFKSVFDIVMLLLVAYSCFTSVY